MTFYFRHYKCPYFAILTYCTYFIFHIFLILSFSSIKTIFQTLEIKPFEIIKVEDLIHAVLTHLRIGVFIWIWNQCIIFRCQLFLCTMKRAFDQLCWSPFKKLVLLFISHSMNTRKGNTSVKQINFLLVIWSKGSILIK